MDAKTHTPSDLTRLLFLEIVPTLVYMSAEQPHLFGSRGLTGYSVRQSRTLVTDQTLLWPAEYPDDSTSLPPHLMLREFN